MRMRVLRLVEYDGDRDWVEKIMSDSKHGTNTYPGGTIKAQTVSSFTTVSEKPKKEPEEFYGFPNYCSNCGHCLDTIGIHTRCNDVKKGPYYCPDCGKEVRKEVQNAKLRN